MPYVDAFFQFVSEELARDHKSSITVYAPTPGTEGWVISCNEAEASGATLSGALNALSQTLNFTSKDLRIDEEPSLVKRVAEIALEQGGSLGVMYADSDPAWRAVTGTTENHQITSGHNLGECLLNMMNQLLGEPND